MKVDEISELKQKVKELENVQMNMLKESLKLTCLVKSLLEYLEGVGDIDIDFIEMRAEQIEEEYLLDIEDPSREEE